MRLIFEYEGDNVRLVSQQPVNVAVAGADPARQQYPGYYIDSRNAAGASLARVRAHDAFSGSVEVFPEPGRPGDTITRVDVARPRGAFTVIVPVPTDADRVTVVRVSPAATDTITTTHTVRSDAADAIATDIATFPLQINR